jgi:galactokinase
MCSQVATATFLEGLGDVLVPSPETKAVRCQQAEHEYCNMPCGIMDQFISALGHPGHLLQIDCRTNVGTKVPMASSDAVILVTNSNVKHELTGSEYPTRVAQCKEATQLLAATFPEVKQLRDATPAMLEQVKAAMGGETHRRARHVIGENARVEAAVRALQSGDFDAVGRLMHASHESLRADFEVSAPELDTLVELAMGFEGVYGSRMTGGGFGGCIVTLVRAGSAAGLMAHLETGYRQATGLAADSFVTRPGAGAGPLSPI